MSGQLSHVLLKTPVVSNAGFQSANTSAENSVSDAQSNQARFKFSGFGRGMLNELKRVSRHEALTRVARGNIESKLVSGASRHAEPSNVAVGNGVLNEVSPLSLHALLKSTLFASVPSFAPAGNDVSAVVPCHADVKSVQFLMSVVIKSLSELLLYHANLALVASGS